MAFCYNCGKQLTDEQNFCASCGTARQVDAQSAVQPQNDSPPEYAPPPQYTQPPQYQPLDPPRPLTPEEQDIRDNKGYAIISYIWFLPIVSYFVAKESPFARFHAVQGINLFILEMVVGLGLRIVNWMFGWFSFFSHVMSALSGISGLCFLVLMIIGIVNAAGGEKKELPVVNAFRFIKN